MNTEYSRSSRSSFGRPVTSYRVRPSEKTLEVGMNPSNNLGSIGQVVDIPLDKLEIGAYQKELSIPRIEKIVSKFDINRMRPIDVSLRDGKYYVFDGQHRANAYYLMGYTHIPAIVHYGLTYEQEAYLFARQQEEVGSVNANHKWNALVQAKDEETMEIVKHCADYGFTILAKNNKGNNFKCVKTLRDLFHSVDVQTFRTIMRCISEAWGYLDRSTDVAILDGIGRLAKTFNCINYNRLSFALAKTTPKILLRDMEDKHHAVRGESRRAAYQIIDLYNKNLRAETKGKLPRLDPTLLK